MADVRSNRKRPLATAQEIREARLFFRALRNAVKGDEVEIEIQEIVDDYGGPDNPILSAWYDS